MTAYLTNKLRYELWMNLQVLGMSDPGAECLAVSEKGVSTACKDLTAVALIIPFFLCAPQGPCAKDYALALPTASTRRFHLRGLQPYFPMLSQDKEDKDKGNTPTVRETIRHSSARIGMSPLVVSFGVV